MSKDLSEFKGSMVAIATPMNTDGSLDFNSLERLVEIHIDNKTDVIEDNMSTIRDAFKEIIVILSSISDGYY